MESEAHGKILLLGGDLVLYPKYYGIVISCSAKILCKLEILSSSEGAIYINSSRFSINTKYIYSPFSIIGQSNVFITEAIKVSLYIISLYKEINQKDISLTIIADDEFYISGKTGLGSSAALTVSIIKCLLRYYQLDNQELLHFVSQVSHFRAQEKIGSGFDISSAVYGSHLFRRIRSELLLSLFDNLNCTLECINQEITA